MFGPTFDMRQQLTGLVDPACPLNWSHPLNRGVVAEWSIVPNVGFRGGWKLRDLTRGGKGYPSDGQQNLSVPQAWLKGGLRFDSEQTNFPAAANYIECADANKLDLVTTFSIDFYANFDAFSGLTAEGTIVSKYNAGPSAAGIRLQGDTGGLLLVTAGGSNAINVSGASAIIAGLHHHCLVSNGSGSTYYVDGVSIGTGTSLSTWFNNAQVLRIGMPESGFFGSGNYSAAFILYGMRFANVDWTISEVKSACREWKAGNPGRWNWLTRGTWFPTTSPPPPPATAGVVVGSPIVGSPMVVGSPIVGGIVRAGR